MQSCIEFLQNINTKACMFKMWMLTISAFLHNDQQGYSAQQLAKLDL
jgi:hypothetical protein